MVGCVHDFRFSNQHFDDIRKMISAHTGIFLSDAKRELVYGRLARRLRKLKLDNFDDYLDCIHADREREMVNFINAITTNLTSFFRENHHFEYLASTLIPALIREKQSSRRIRIWSAGCSSGEEPYSIAITLRESIADIDNWDIRILATDIDSNVLDRAKSGIYAEDGITGMSSARLCRWFQKGRDKQSGKVRVKPELRAMITFRQLNLMDDWPMRGPFDILFCRNVVIYFDKATQKMLFERFAGFMTAHAHLIIGHSETLHNVSERFELIGQTIHRRIR